MRRENVGLTPGAIGVIEHKQGIFHVCASVSTPAPYRQGVLEDVLGPF